MNIYRLKPLEKPVKTIVPIPGSKSYTNRALLMAALCKNPVTILNPLKSDDTEAMIGCLKELGITIVENAGSITVVDDISMIKNRVYKLDAHLSGTTIRFILALACIIPGVKTVYGAAGLNKRPIGDLVDGLKQLGAEIEYLDTPGYPPLRVLSSQLRPGMVKMHGDVSSQYFSALLMIAPLIGPITIRVLGKQISKPYIDMTIDTMKKFAVGVTNNGYKKYTVRAGQSYFTDSYTVEGDVSSASYFAAIACLTHSQITLENLNPQSLQGDMQFLSILRRMGKGKRLVPVNVDMEDCPDQVQTLAVLAAFAPGTTIISGIKSLRVKETDRVVAVQHELKKMGIQTKSTHNSLTIYGGHPHKARINTYGDHRMAMAFAVAGSKLAGMEIINPSVVNKTWPEFWQTLQSIGIRITSRNLNNIVLIGMRGSGKTTVGKLLAKALRLSYVDIDEMVVQQTKMSIPTIVEKYGWNHFRDLEASVVANAAQKNHQVIATGGGVILQPKNITTLKHNGFCVYLTASVKNLLQRTRGDRNRPSLGTKISTIAKQRTHLYEHAADMIIDTNQITPKLVAQEVYDYLSQN